MSPSEFWRLHPAEFWWLVAASRPVKMYGKMTEHEVRAIYEATYGPPPSERARHGAG